MEPKFQSSFIPKGPLAPTSGPTLAKPQRERSLMGAVGLILFIVSAVLAAGVFGYKYYLKHSIETMGVELENFRATLDSGSIQELVRLDNRILSTKELLSKHYVLSPLFGLLEISAPQTVRFNSFNFSLENGKIKLLMQGEARGYGALALQADIFNKSTYFKNPIFSDLTLNTRGDVVFSFAATLEESLISYLRQADLTDTGLEDESELLEELELTEPVPDLETI